MVGCAAVFSAVPSVSVAPFPVVGVPSFPCAGCGGRWAGAGAVRTASDPCLGGVWWRACAFGGRAVSAGGGAVLVPPLWHALPVCAPWCPPLPPLSLRHGPWSFPFLARWWFPAPVLCRPLALSLWATACYLGLLLAPLPGCPFPSLAVPLPVPFPFPVWWWWGWGGACGALMAHAWKLVVWSHRRRIYGV